MSNSLDIVSAQRRKPLRISTDVHLLAERSDSPTSSSSHTNQNTTPESTQTTSIPQCFFHVLCMHDFESLDPDHLPFCKDEVLTVIKREHSGWWAAMRPHGDRVGWIPGSFVLPLDSCKTLDHADRTSVLYESFNDHPLSAAHDPWVPVSEECAALAFRLATPTDLVLYKGFFDDRSRNHNREPLSSLPDDDLNIDDVFLPSIPRLPPHGIQKSHSLNPLLSEPEAPHPTRPMFDLTLHHYIYPCKVDGQTAFPHFTSPLTPETASSLGGEDSIAALKSAAISQDVANSDDRFGGQSQHKELPLDFYPTGTKKGVLDIKLLSLTIRNPDSLARQLCVLMHTLYASIRQNHCLDWIRGRRSTEVTGLRHFLDIHDDISSWVRKSISVDDDMTGQTETTLPVEFWVRVAEACRSLQNFDSLGAIILALSRCSSSFGPAWTQCAPKQTFVKLHDMLDATNAFMDVMHAARGPVVPFVRRSLENIKREYPSNLPNGPGLVAPCKMQLAAITTLLRHQSSAYDFETAKSTDGPPIQRFTH